MRFCFENDWFSSKLFTVSEISVIASNSFVEISNNSAKYFFKAHRKNGVYIL